jgi:hypothetical protein
MLSLGSPPSLELAELEEGQRRTPTCNQLQVGSSPFFLISIVGEPETAGVVAIREHVAVSIAFTRTSLEYALGGAIAIAVAEELETTIDDDWRFFSPNVHITPTDLLMALKVGDSGGSYREAAEQLEERLGLAH